MDPPDNLEVKYHEGMPFLTLGDIAEQITKIYGKTIIIDVWIELALNGYIYRYVGPEGEWKSTDIQKDTHKERRDNE